MTASNSNMDLMDIFATKSPYLGVKTHLWLRLFNHSREMRYWIVKLNHQYNEYSLSFTTEIIIRLLELYAGTQLFLDSTKERTITNAKISY